MLEAAEQGCGVASMFEDAETLEDACQAAIVVIPGSQPGSCTAQELGSWCHLGIVGIAVVERKPIER